MPTRAAGLARLEAFLPRAGRDYAETRNHVAPPAHANVSRLSPWVRARLVTEAEVAGAARARHGFREAEKFIQEVYWRTYWKGWLEQRPEAWTRYLEAVPRLRDGLRGERRSAHEAARAGRTGIAGFDDWARELVATGWMHNHARMWFASIWIFTLRLPWELGAAFFMEHLLDGDPASNTLSWRWVAGLQTAGKTYLARADNIARYTGGEHAPSERQLAAEAFVITEEPLRRVALAERPVASPAGLAALARGGRLGWWLHAEDLAVDTGDLAAGGGVGAGVVAAGFAGWPAGLAARAGWAAPVAAWQRAALGDGAARAEGFFGCGFERGESADLAAALADWARREKLARVAAYEPPVGPWRDEARVVETALAAAGVGMVWIRRGWDAALWPRAARGYFPFWAEVKASEGAPG